MSGSYFSDPLAFLVNTLFGLYILAVMLRFLLQAVRANFYNPLCQFLVKITHPPLQPLRRVVPSVGSYDMASVVLMVVLQFIALWLAFRIQGQGAPAGMLLVITLYELVNLLLNVYLFAILIRVVISWINPGAHHPVLELIDAITRPVIRPVQRMLPSTGGLDFSPMVVLIGIFFIKMLIQPIFMDLARAAA
ncbi:MAG: YggT family protein [Ectothiorhodospiraceae bacterium]|nr:YggT family protein [Ectothiorhodospiraceae bacterium]